MQIKFWSSFQKRENSTKIPSGSETLALSGNLIEPCSIENPTFKIERLAQDAVPSTLTYAYIPAFGRYYFVSDWDWAEGLWQCKLAEDYLGSFKTSIGTTEAYIERATSVFNGEVIDTLYPVTTDFVSEDIELDSMYYRIAPSGGCYVLGIINNWNFSIPQAGGCVTYYAMTVAEMRNLMAYLMSDTFTDDAGFPSIITATQQLLHSTAKAFINPMQYITSCMWYPLDVEDIAELTPSSIVLGPWELEIAQNNLDGHKIEAFVFTSIVEESIPDHPQYTRGTYLNYAPYTRITLRIPPFGSIPIDPSFRSVGNYLKCYIYVDVITGKAQLRVTIQESSLQVNDPVVIAESSAMFGIPIQLSQMLPDYLGATANIASFAGNVASGFGTGGVAGAGTSALLSLGSVGSALTSLFPQTNVTGISGSWVQNVMPPIMTMQYAQLANENLSELGRPLCQVRRINTMSGFVKCGEVTIDYNCFLNEKRTIENYLKNGFFWE